MEIYAGFPNFNPNPAPGDDHMHQAEYVLEGDNRLTTHWKSMVDGEVSDEHSITFELKRRQ